MLQAISTSPMYGPHFLIRKLTRCRQCCISASTHHHRSRHRTAGACILAEHHQTRDQVHHRAFPTSDNGECWEVHSFFTNMVCNSHPSLLCSLIFFLPRTLLFDLHGTPFTCVFFRNYVCSIKQNTRIHLSYQYTA